MEPNQIFLSHNHGDKEFVRRLAGDLRDAGIRVWLDEWELRVGDSLVERVEAGISQAGYLAIVLSPRSVGSAWVKRELSAALAEEIRRRGVFILPILLEDCDLPLFVRDKMYADFRRQYSEGLKAILRTVLPGDVTPPKLVFDSRRDDPAFQTWALHCSDGVALTHIRLVAAEDGATHPVIRTAVGRSVGLNRSIPSLHGRAVFEYRVSQVTRPGEHVYFAMIPIQETGYDRVGVIEVGTSVASDPTNGKSRHRVRYHVPISHQSDGLWHAATIDFDFRDTPTAFYAIFAARFNEGIDAQGDGELEMGSVRLYSW